MFIGLFIVCAVLYIVYKKKLGIILPQIIFQWFGYTITATHSLCITIAIISLFCFLLGTRRVLKWPIFLFFISFILAELFLYILVRYFIRLLESIFIRPSTLNNAENYEEWYEYACETDKLHGREIWKARSKSKYYNENLTRTFTDELKSYRELGDIEKLIKILQICINKSMNGIFNEHLYSKSLVGTKYVIEEYIQEIVTSLKYLTKQAQLLKVCKTYPTHVLSSPIDYSITTRTADKMYHSITTNKSDDLLPLSTSSSTTQRLTNTNTNSDYSELQSSFSEQTSNVLTTDNSSTGILSTEFVLQALKDMKSHYGATALCLSGGAGIGHYHWGIVKALLSSGYLPKIISGTSSGAVVAAVICTRSDDELRSTLQAEVLLSHLNCFDAPWMDRIKRYIKCQAMFDRDVWLEKLQWFAGADGFEKVGLTFKEAYEKTGRILNITATNARKHYPPLCLNYLSTPNVTIASAVLASAAVPGLIHPVHLIEKIVDKHGQISYRPLHGGRLKFRDGSFENDIPLNTLSEVFGCSYFLVSQTNPHIIPFFFNARGQGGLPSGWRLRGGAYRGGFLLAGIELLLKEDMKKNLRVLGMLDLLPTVFGQDWSFLFLQEFQGQITMVPHVRLIDYFRLISDIKDVKEISHYLQEGKLTAWRKFGMIKNREIIRLTLKDCIQILENKI
ncbi:unnamed protein product [Rotaria sp. Silwood2]|nr:unnamed protein product [Rotaria sp. Silwood2]CAF2942099.1 unnamed protein product [Rotaria sp. Silwood2]CAF3109224.1 unnamed protein product [Rotaria sp. Silwood2]CAF3179871.1 unnamed protein product [Rotaria sp. Silwood2]CAF4000221.1 unnamed protein product [Rotaria sp. Silwood2]